MKSKIINYRYDYIDLLDVIELAKSKVYISPILYGLTIIKPTSLQCEFEIYTLEAALRDVQEDIDIISYLYYKRPNKSL
jgi:hypothetical protein